MINTRKKAFTLVELVVVVVILGILATIAIVGYKVVIDRSNQGSANAAAQSFDRQVRSMTRFGNSASNNPNDIDPRKPTTMLEMLLKGDIRDATTAGTALQNSQLRVLMWQGVGASTVKWTRLSCPSGACTNIDVTGGTQTSTTGAIGKLYDPAVAANICMQFHKGSQDVWMTVSTTPATASVIASTIGTGCPTATFAGMTAATSTTYADLAGATALTDPTW